MFGFIIKGRSLAYLHIALAGQFDKLRVQLIRRVFVDAASFFTCLYLLLDILE